MADVNPVALGAALVLPSGFMLVLLSLFRIGPFTNTRKTNNNDPWYKVGFQYRFDYALRYPRVSWWTSFVVFVAGVIVLLVAR